MEYEHEKKIRSWVELELFRYGHHFREYDAEVINELKEVYAKAKAFDEILNIDLDQHEIIVHGQVEDIVNKYREDK